MRNMRKYLILTSILALTACGGGGGAGSDGANGAPGKSAYEIWLDAGNTGTEQDFLDSISGQSAYQIWLDAGNTGTEQDFLDSLVAGNGTSESNDDPAAIISQYASLRELMQDAGVTVTYIPWDAHGGYYRFETSSESTGNSNPMSGNDSRGTRHLVYNEKELSLVNYGVYSSFGSSQDEFSATPTSSYSTSSWINNREGIGANVYTPTENTVFSGSTMAYLRGFSSDNIVPIFIKGDAQYTYSSTSPKLVLNFDNYYTITLQNGSANVVSGTNNTGNSRFDINTGIDVSASNEVPTQTGNIGFVKKGSVEEVVGKYDVIFVEHPSYATFAPNGSFYLDGAFGGTKQ